MKPRGRLFSSITRLFDAIADYVSAKDIIQEDRRNTELARRRAHIRVAALREKFGAVRDLTDTMNARLDEYKDRRED
jgi:uncharacterized coiled-coil DUF342 family protein